MSLRILVLEDSKDDVKLIERVLKKDGLIFTLMVVDSGELFEAALTNYEPDLVLSDHGLPRYSSAEAFEAFKRHSLDIPFILVTGAVSEEFAVTSLKNGIDDYILKDNLSKLPISIRRALDKFKTENERKVAEEAVRVQNEELLKINGELDSFVYMASHNLRAPLMSISGLVNLIRIEGGQRADQTSQYLDLITESINRLDRNLHDILDYSRNSRSPLRADPIDLKSLFNGCLEELTYMVPRNEFDFRLSITGGVDFFSDLVRLKIIVSNLLSNSIKYRDARKGKLAIEVQVNTTLTNVIILVKDNGTGIHVDYHEKLFEMFFRATENAQGSGLGLYIVKEITNKLGGTISFNSSLGFGTEFILTMPNRHSLPEEDT
ncbi:MAG: hybrid sensor histidine kinase/response regulator [Imperialibacter sp.]|uniref:sensor histidine kinase n=1 Tax=Imperialibacter sp. TaxID=2038411 RepID=UPI0032EA9B80